jgi:outer membrane protein OmpA-like peptidoglycan-associated protein
MPRRPIASRRATPGRRRLPALLLLAPMLVGGCAKRQTVVLVADPDGSLGRAEVSTAGGTQALTRANDSTTVSGRASAPSAVTTATPSWIATTFREAMTAEPAPPERFILYFEAGTTVLDAKSQAAIAGIVAAAARRKAISVAISGHADATGSDELNDRLAFDRAKRVEALLVERGVAQGTMSVSSHGKGNPAVQTPDGAAEPRNRRVEVIVQ